MCPGCSVGLHRWQSLSYVGTGKPVMAMQRLRATLCLADRSRVTWVRYLSEAAQSSLSQA